jgi:hypothetical protein
VNAPSSPGEPVDLAWAQVLATIVDRAHLVTGIDLSSLVDGAVRPLGLSAEVLVVDLAQRVLSPVWPTAATPVDVEGSPTGQAYQLGEIVLDATELDQHVLCIPMLDGTERLGVLRVALTPSIVDDETLHRRLWSLAGLMGHLTMAKMAYSDQLWRLRSISGLSIASELLWQQLPPRTFATDDVVVTALLEPSDQVAGDAYDYSVDAHVVHLAVFDGVGHDLHAGLTTALAVTAIRNARRSGESDLISLAARADTVLAEQPGPANFVTAALARLDTRTGALSYLLAGHPPPMLIRDGRIVKELAITPRLPLGIALSGGWEATVGEEQLEPGDRVLLYSDGVTEARDADGEFFGEQRLAAFTERASQAHLSAPETMRRLVAAVLTQQNGQLQDDATLLMVEWSTTHHRRNFPTFRNSP